MRLELNVGEQVFRLAKSGPGYAVLGEPASIPAGEALLVARVDGRLHKRLVVVTNATNRDVPFDDRVEYRFMEDPGMHSPELPQMKQLGLFD